MQELGDKIQDLSKDWESMQKDIHWLIAKYRDLEKERITYAAITDALITQSKSSFENLNIHPDIKKEALFRLGYSSQGFNI